jgi:hypothetical protein
MGWFRRPLETERLQLKVSESGGVVEADRRER